MLKRFSLDYALLSLVVDLIGTGTAFWIAGRLRIAISWGKPLGPYGVYSYRLWGIGLALWLLVSLVTSLYDPRHTYKAWDEFQNAVLSVMLFALVMAGLLYFTERELSRLLLVYLALSQGVLLLGWRVIARILFRVFNGRVRPAHRVLIIGAGEVGQRVARMIREYAWTGLHLVGYLDDDLQKRGNGLPILGFVCDARTVVQEKGIDDVVIALPRRAYGQVNDLVVALHDLPVRVRVVPDYFSLALYRATVEDFGGVPMINLRDPALNDVQRFIKRLFDLVVGSVATLLALPVMGLVALAIKLDSPGPVLFRQQRVGENGRIFTMYKFRSMVVGAERLQDQVNEVDESGHIIHKKCGDPRVTRVGRFIRKFSLDELPQLFNVLKGDMSLVGPRPELPWLVEMYEPWQRKRFAVPQGITGWWQVNGRSDRPMHLHTEDDLYYIQNYSLFLDLWILWKTIWVTLRGKGAY